MDARDHDVIEDVGLVRLTTWATAAAVALTVATLAGLSTSGSQRASTALASLTGRTESPPVVQAATRQAASDNDRRSVNEALRLLATDRDRLATRIGSLERNLEDVTGSIKSQAVARPLPERVPDPPPDLDDLPVIRSDPAPAKPAEAEAPVPPAAASKPLLGPITLMEFATGPVAFPPVPQAPAARISALPTETTQPPATLVSRTEFGVDIGSGSDLEQVRLLWNAARTQHGRLLGNLRPVVVKRKDAGGKTDYRLVVGPLANAGAAAKLCATLGNADVICSPRPYNGDRLRP